MKGQFLKQVTELRRDTFLVRRVVSIDEVLMDNGGVRYNVKVGDEGKKPFITRWFNDIGQAFSFYDGFKNDAVSLESSSNWLEGKEG